MLTDLALGACNASWGVALLRRARAQRQWSQALWGAGFIAAAAAAVLGGASHAVGDQSPAARRALWKGTLLAAGGMSASMLAGTVAAAAPRPLQRWLLAGTLAKLLAYWGWMASRDRFLYVMLDYGSAMVGVAAFHGPVCLRKGAESSRYILGGVLVSLVGAFVQQRRVALHRHFNHNDLYHVIQIGACYLFYRGGRLLQDRRERNSSELETTT